MEKSIGKQDKKLWFFSGDYTGFFQISHGLRAPLPHAIRLNVPKKQALKLFNLISLLANIAC